ncbi:IPT/TIG domain-containing protein [Pedobacter sp. P26]|uniref:IPT/TIG domain-containing protein n=1 Tax=Pedobacter sp. P26 TaxID=3423956 RepID=UPI003D66AD6B
MKTNNDVKTLRWQIHWILLALIALSLTQCKQEKLQQEDGYDPSKEVMITDFYPRQGGVGNNLIIYGDNFGNDISKIKVTIGGKPAKIIGVKNNSLYCIIPEEAYDGNIKITIVDGNNQQLAKAISKEAFSYTRKLLVSTFLGKYYQVASNFEEKEGPFNDCGAFKGVTWLTLDPKNPNHLYFSADINSCRLIDFEKNM